MRTIRPGCMWMCRSVPYRYYERARRCLLARLRNQCPVRKTIDRGGSQGSAGRAITELGQDAELQAKILAQGIVPRSVGLGDFDAHIRREMDRLDPLLKNIGSRIGN